MLGNNREWDDDAPAVANKLAIEMNFFTGTGKAFVDQSCMQLDTRFLTLWGWEHAYKTECNAPWFLHVRKPGSGASVKNAVRVVATYPTATGELDMTVLVKG